MANEIDFLDAINRENNLHDAIIAGIKFVINLDIKKVDEPFTEDELREGVGHLVAIAKYFKEL